MKIIVLLLGAEMKSPVACRAYQSPAASPLDPKLLAAYRLGWCGFGFQVYQKHFWEDPAWLLDGLGYGMDLALKQFYDALLDLIGEIPAHIYGELRQHWVLLDEFSRVSARAIVRTGKYQDRARGRGPVPCERTAERLCSLAQCALPPISEPGRLANLGAAVGSFSLEIQQRGFKERTPGHAQSRVAEAARALPNKYFKCLPELKRLVTDRRRLATAAPAAPAMFLRQVLSLQHMKSDPPEFVVIRKQDELHARIEVALSKVVINESKRKARSSQPPPKWDRVALELRFEGAVIREVRCVAEKVIEVLDKFQRQKWPRAIKN